MKLIFPRISDMIEHVYEKLLFPFQFAYIIWPLFIITALAYSLQISRRRGWLRALVQKVRTNLLYTWLSLFVIWLVTLFAQTPLPTLIPEPANSIIFFSGLGFLLFLELLRLRSLPRRIRARVGLHEVHGAAYFRSLNPDEFEELVAETYRALGYSASRVGKSGDHGIDVEVRTPNGQRWVIQCKRYRDPVGERYVRELYGTLTSEGAERGVLVTSAYITPPAETWARGKPIDLVDGQALLRLVEQARRRAQGSLFDRLIVALISLFQPARRPAGLKSSSAANTQPVRVRSAAAPPGAPERIPASPLRLCPVCGAPLQPHPKRPGRSLYRCTRYPRCRAVIEG